jgi:hypothetical protein
VDNSLFKLLDFSPLVLHDAVNERFGVLVKCWWQLSGESVKQVTLGLVGFTASHIYDGSEFGNNFLVLRDGSNDFLVERDCRKFLCSVHNDLKIKYK